MGYDVWKTLYTNDFDTRKYLYHYTSVDKAIKIIHSEGLRFAAINNTNDTSEAKLKIIYVDDSDNEIPSSDVRVQKVSAYLKKHHDIVRLLCFSMDPLLSPKAQKAAAALHNNHLKDKYFDVSGRGFALPRMWSQYASNNEGVCFIINKGKFEEQLRSRMEFFKCNRVSYKGFFDCYKINENKLDLLYKKIEMVSNGGLTLLNLMQRDRDFLNYNFFEKLNDWENEHEYRYVTLTDNSQNTISIKNLFRYLEGVVIGEKIDPAYENVIKRIINDKCEVRKVVFGNRACKLK